MTDNGHAQSKGQMRVPEPESNLIATFESLEAARRAADKLRTAGFDARRVHVDEESDATATLAAEQMEDSEDLAPGPVLMATKPMVRGGLTGGVAGTLIFGGVGLMVAAVLLLLDVVNVPMAALIVLAAALGGSVAGGVFGGATRAEHEQVAEMTSEHRVGVTAVRGARMEEAEAILRQVGPGRIDRFDPSRG